MKFSMCCAKIRKKKYTPTFLLFCINKSLKIFHTLCISAQNYITGMRYSRFRFSYYKCATMKKPIAKSAPRMDCNTEHARGKSQRQCGHSGTYFYPSLLHFLSSCSSSGCQCLQLSFFRSDKYIHSAFASFFHSLPFPEHPSTGLLMIYHVN